MGGHWPLRHGSARERTAEPDSAPSPDPSPFSMFSRACGGNPGRLPRSPVGIASGRRGWERVPTRSFETFGGYSRALVGSRIGRGTAPARSSKDAHPRRALGRMSNSRARQSSAPNRNIITMNSVFHKKLFTPSQQQATPSPNGSSEPYDASGGAHVPARRIVFGFPNIRPAKASGVPDVASLGRP